MFVNMILTEFSIEHLWEEMHIPPHEASEFAKKYFYPETIMNYVHIFQEISRLSKIRGLQHEVLMLIEQREAYIQRLKQISQQLLSNKRSISNIYEDTLVTNEVPDIIQNLRMATVKVILRIIHWREKLPKKMPFIFNSQNYILKMRNDIDFLKLTPLGPYLEKSFPLEGNPLLLPSQYINERFKSHTPSIKQKNLFATGSVTKSSQKSSSSVKNNTLPVTSTNANVTVSGAVSNIAATSASPLPMINVSANVSMIKSMKLIKMLEEQGERFVEDCIRVDRVIFVGEDKFLNELRELEIKDRAATKIQCFVRNYMAKKIVKHMKKEKAPKHRQTQKRQKRLSTSSASHQEDLEQETQQQNDRLDSLLQGGVLFSIPGRYKAKIFDKREEDD
jgi:hypothetical protein